MAWPDVRFDFSARTVLITGGSNGIGRGLADGFRDAGARVVITGTQPRDAYADRFEGLEYRQLLMEDHDGIAALALSFDRLDVLVNNAGLATRNPSELTAEGFERTIAVNLTAVARMTYAAKDLLVATQGSVLNIASMTSYFGSPAIPGYASSKGAIVQLTKSLAIAWAAEGVRVNAIAPGWIESNLTKPLMADPARSNRILDRTAIRRWGVPADLAGCALFLSSSAAAFITGVTVNVDGGYSIMM
jgi:NAD(P)-dependent dehydrogenase (short-subunit alcohol dehydrogenase family)